jgi:cobalt-zinc-cadmium efflux system protein
MHVHAHSHAAPSRSRAFALGMALNSAFIVAEAAFGIRAHSLALLADAGHNLGDVLGLGLAWGALVLAQRPPTEHHTYGMRRASILAALTNGILAARRRGRHRVGGAAPAARSAAVAGTVVMAVAGAGVVINGVTALLFVAGRKEDLNFRGAFLHMAADAVVSLGVVIAGLFMARTGWSWLDPVISLAIAVVIVVGTWESVARVVPPRDGRGAAARRSRRGRALSRRAAGRRRGARSPHLGDEHDGVRADRAPGEAGCRGGRRAAPAHQP